MPYRASGNWTQVKKNDRWVNYKKHDSHQAAVKHAQAINISYINKKKTGRA